MIHLHVHDLKATESESQKKSVLNLLLNRLFDENKKTQ